MRDSDENDGIPGGRADLPGVDLLGELAPRPAGRRRFFSKSFLFILAVCTPIAIFGYRELYTKLIERELPAITLKAAPAGVGIKPMGFEFDVEDPQSGLNDVVVRVEQGGQPQDVFKKSYDLFERVHKDTIQVSLSGKELGLKEGNARLMVTAFDKSLWFNRRLLSVDIKVDYHSPEVEIITTQHNAVRGGMELVFFRVTGEEHEVFSSVRVGTHLFPGFAARHLDRDFEPYKDIFFAFFAIPLEYDEERDKLRVFVRDAVGNTTTAPFFYRVGGLAQARREEVLTPQFMQVQVEPLYQKFLEYQSKRNGVPAPAAGTPSTPEQWVERFKAVNETYRTEIGNFFESFFTHPISQRLWDGKFLWLAGSTKVSFGDERHFTYEGLDAGSAMSEGVDFSTIPRSSVPAANDGSVIFADDLGPYGNTVIVDHGFGLSSIYMHLTQASVREGDRVKKGQALGLTGNTGLMSSDKLHFQIRLFGVPVRPAEWFDQSWINAHIMRKINDVKKQLGLTVYVPVE